MNKPPSFGRRGGAPRPATAADKQIALTPEQRAYLFDAEASPASGDAAPQVDASHVRHAGLIACAAATAVVSALTLFGAPHDSVAAVPPQMEEQAKAVFQLAGEGFAPLTLAWSILVVGSNLAANLWVTRKVCAWRDWSSFPAFALVGAVISVALAYITALVGLGESEIGYAMEALSGAGAAALYRLLAGRRSFQ